MTLLVTMTDLYANAYYDIEVLSLDRESIEQAIIGKYDEWRGQLSHHGAGAVRVSDKNSTVARGSITWWWNGGYTIHLDMTEHGAHVQTSGHHTVCQTPV